MKLAQPKSRLRKFRPQIVRKQQIRYEHTEYITHNQQLGKLQNHRVVIVQNDGETQFIADQWANKPLLVQRSKAHPELFILFDDAAGINEFNTYFPSMPLKVQVIKNK